MKIGIFIDNFFQTQTYKDPGVIASALFNLGHEVTIYCFNADTDKFQQMNIKRISKNDSESKAFWFKENITIVVLYSWLSLRFSGLILAIKSAQKKVVLKLDSDGHLIYPLRPTYLRTWGRNNSLLQSVKHLSRLIQWTILGKAVSRAKINQLAVSDAAIIESPLALINLNDSLKFWKNEELCKKIHFIPNPVNDDIAMQSSNNLKNNTIIAIGRWDDKHKNRIGLIAALAKNSSLNWHIVIIGNGAKKIKTSILRKNTKMSLELIEAMEQVKHQDIYQLLQASKIFFAPSNCESFNLAAAEALCSGCSFAGTPLESFYYFSQDGKFGSVAKDFSQTAIQQALATEIAKWESNKYKPDEISSYWRKELAAKIVGQKIETLLKNL